MTIEAYDQPRDLTAERVPATTPLSQRRSPVDRSPLVQPPWIRALFLFFKQHRDLPKDFVGQVEVNLFKGGVTNITVRQSYKEETGT